MFSQMYECYVLCRTEIVIKATSNDAMMSMLVDRAVKLEKIRA